MGRRLAPMNAPIDQALASLPTSFWSTKPITKGGVVTLAAGLPMTAQNLAMLESAWRFDADAPKVQRG